MTPAPTSAADQVVAPASQGPGDPSADSFYHLARTDVRRCSCQGLACFVARHLDPGRWRAAALEQPRVYCLGRCYAGPAHGADGTRPAVTVDAREGIVLGRIARGGARSISEYQCRGGYEALRIALSRAPEEIVASVEASGLRGRGGAGFPTGRKWRAAFEQPSPQKYVIANGDEGDAGAYVDRFIMEDDPHALIEAMAIAAYAVGASEGWVYVRCEYPNARPVLEAAIA